MKVGSIVRIKISPGDPKSIGQLRTISKVDKEADCVWVAEDKMFYKTSWLTPQRPAVPSDIARPGEHLLQSDHFAAVVYCSLCDKSYSRFVDLKQLKPCQQTSMDYFLKDKYVDA